MSQTPSVTTETLPTSPRSQGRPTKYKPEYDQRAYELCLVGAVDTQLAEIFDVAIDTITEWKKVHPSFSASIKRAKDELDSKVEQSLYRRAMGYNHEITKVFCNRGEIVETTIEEPVLPDTTAMIFWLKNRRPKEWRDVNHTEHSGTITHAVDAPPQETREQWLERKEKERLAKAVDVTIVEVKE